MLTYNWGSNRAMVGERVVAFSMGVHGIPGFETYYDFQI